MKTINLYFLSFCVLFFQYSLANSNYLGTSNEQQISVENVISANGKKVKICHNGQALEVSISALQAHLNHGDCVGECSSSAKMIQVNNYDNPNFEKEKQNLVVTLMPNPTNDILNIKLNTKQTSLKEIEIFSINGTKH